jgi:glutamate N-acetyltransferase/amino-acid N-acetyltransferase
LSVTAPLGFRAAGVAAGLKESGARDVAVVLNDGPSCAAAAVFTANRVQAAPVQWSRQVVTGGRVRAVVLNSGGANACTGPPGFADTHETAERLAHRLAGSAGEMAVCSTGLIGERLPMDLLLPGVDAAVAEAARGGGLAAADAIRTTDTVVKIAFRRGQAPGTAGNAGAPGGYTIGGMAKGAGMLAPALATMLCVLTTDAELDAGELDTALRRAAAVTFGRLDTDGCMSTNDTVLLLASGAAGVRPDPGEFAAQLTAVCADLARQLQLDAEGAGKAIAIEVTGAASEQDAETVGRAVARSALLKCAIAGEDPNWGRVLAAAGTTGAAFEPDRLNVAINGIWVCRNGYAADDRGKVDLSPRDVTITVDLAAGPDSATITTTDLTVAYVHENTAYST